MDTGAAISVAPRSFAPGIPLQALERPVELRTATGVRIPIFGKKTMQLLASPLCLEVSFVIAEVTTPILGVDTLLRENLSLRFEGCQQQLVHASGVCTQLTQEGKLLYLRALPAQVGSPIFMIGSLLQDSILPENKLEPTALGVRATLSKEEVLDKGGASDHSFSQENLDKEHNLGKNKTALGPAPLQPLGAQTAYTAKKNKPSAKESSHQQLGLKRKKQSGHPAASKLRNWQQTRSIKEIELALMAAEERNSLDPDTRSDLSFRFLLTFSLVNQWQLTKAEVGTAYPARPESTISMEDLGLRAFAADSNIFLGEQLAIMRFQGELLIGGAQLEQECFLTKLSATGLLLKTTQLDHNTPVSFRNMTLEYDQLEHSLCLYMPCAFYMHLVNRHSLQHEPPATLPQEELAPEASRQHSQVLDAKQRKLYQKTVGQLVWLKACRPDTSFVIEQLNQSFDNPTAHAHAQLLCLLRYLSGTMHYSLILQPCSKKILEKASNTELLAYSSTSWTAESPISTACLSCFGVTMATSCRQARGAWTQQAAEVEAVVLAKQLASHCQSLIQGMQLDLALPELKIFFCSLTCDLVTGRPLALKLGLSRRNRQVQLQDGQLRLCKVLPHKNLAECLTKNLSTASFHRLLPKLMVHTRAVKAQALLTMLGGENQASFCSSSFFIGMVALNPPMAQTRASTTNSLQLLSLSEGTEENAKALAFPELSLNQLQKWIASRQLTQPSIDSLTGYSLSIDSLTGYSLSLSIDSLTGYSLSIDSLTGYSLSIDSLTGYSLSIDSLTGYSLSIDSLTGYSLSIDSLTGYSLSIDSLTGYSLSIDSLTGYSLSIDSLTRYSLSKEVCQKSLQRLTDDKLELGSPESESFSDQLCTVSFHILRKDFCHIFRKDFCRKGFSDQLCTESFELWICQPQLDLVTSLSLQQLCQRNFQLPWAQLSFHKFSQKNLESLSAQLCRNHSESLIDKRQYRFQSFSFQISSSSLGSGTLNQLSAEINKFLEKNFGQQLAENGFQQNLFQDQQQLQDSNLAQKNFQQPNLEQPASQEHLSQLRLQDPASAISRQLPKEFLSTAGLQKAAWPAATLTDNLSEQDLSDRSFEQNRFFQKNFGHRISEKQLQQNLSQDHQQLQKPNLAQITFQQLSFEQPSFSEKILNNELGKSIFQEFDHQNLDKKQLAKSNFNQTRKEACKEQLLPACSQEASVNQQLSHSSLVQQSVAKDASLRELGPAYSQGAPGRQELLQRELPEAQLSDSTSSRTPLQSTACRRELLQHQLSRKQLHKGDLQQDSFQNSSLTKESFSTAPFQPAAWKQRPSERQLPQQQLFRRDFCQDSFSASSLQEESFRAATSQTEALRKSASDRQLQKQQLGNRNLQNSSFEENTFDNKQLFSTTLGQQSVAKAASPRELLPACLPGATGEQELLQKDLPEAQLADKNFLQNTFATTSLQPRPSARQLQRQQLEEENFTAHSLEALCLSSFQRHSFEDNNFEDPNFEAKTFKEKSFFQKTFTDSSLPEQSFSTATSQTTALRPGASDRQLQNQQLGRKDFQTSSFTEHSFPTSSFTDSSLPRNSFTGNSFQQETFEEENLAAESFATSTLTEETFPDTSFAEENFYKSSFDKSSFKKSSLEESSFQENSFEKNSFEKNSFEKNSFEKNNFEKTSFEKNSFEKNSFEKNSFEKNSFEKNSFEKNSFEKNSFEKNSFEKSSFKKTAAWTESSFAKSSLEESSFKESSFTPSSLTKSSFHHNSFDKTTFEGRALQSNSFYNSDFEESSFENSSFNQSSFEESSFDQSSLEGSSSQSSFEQSSLEPNSFEHQL